MRTGHPATAAPWLMWAGLAAWTALFALLHAHHIGGSWHYVLHGARLIERDGAPGGLYLYASHPELQMGPLSFLVALPWTYLPTMSGRLLAVLLMTALGPVLLALVARLAAPERRRPAVLVPLGCLFLPVWTEVATKAGHLDDVLALTLAVLAMHAMVSRNAVLTGLLLAASADAKPWAIAFVPLILALPRSAWLRSVAAWAGGLAAAWLPFVAADPGTVHALSHFVLPNAPSSALRAIGVNAPTTPPWDRPAQMALGILCAAVATRRGRWGAVVLAGLAVRILLDPSVFTYYTAGLLCGAVIFDLVCTSWRVPWTTLGGFVLVFLPHYTHAWFDLSAAQMGAARAAYAIGALALLCLAPSRLLAQPLPAAQPIRLGVVTRLGALRTWRDQDSDLCA